MATPTVETKIWLALRNRLATFVATPPAPFVWPGENAVLPLGTCLEVTHMPNRPQRRYLGSDEPPYRPGLLQVGVLTIPGFSQHQAVATEIAGDVAGHFPKDSRLAYDDIVLRISEDPTVGASFRDDKRNRYVTPVTIRYHTEA